jgi:protein-S-isoprenylcysteine O-methyltransferase Ste14
MNRTRSHWLVAGTLAAAAVATVIMVMGSMSGFSSSVTGDSPASMSGVSTAILAVGMLIILSLEFSHQNRRNARRAGMARVADHPAVVPVAPARG